MHFALPTMSARSSGPTQMAEALQNLQHAVSQCEDAVFFMNPVGIITRANPAFERLTGYPELEVVGKDLSVLTDQSAQSNGYQALWQSIFAKKQFNGTLALKTKSGDLHEVEVAITPVHGVGGRIVSLVGTGRRSARTAAPKPMNQDPRPQDPSAARMLHDLNNILLVMLAHADLAMDALAPEHPARRHVESSKSAAQSAAALIRESARSRDCPSSPQSFPDAYKAQRTGSSESPAPGTAYTAQPGEATPATILLVEDESLVLSSNAEFLKAAGYNVLSASTGGEALDLVESFQGRIDLLVTDMVLPQVSGPELASSVVAAHPETKVLAISGHPADYVLKQPGIGHYLAKPFSPDALEEKIRGILLPKKPARGVGTH